MVKLAISTSSESAGVPTATELLGLKQLSAMKMHEQLLLGLPFKALVTFMTETGLVEQDVYAILKLPTRTLARRKTTQTLSPDESEHLVRLSKVYSQALQLFNGNRAATTEWFGIKRPALFGHRPIDLAQTAAGTQLVADLIFQLEDGIIV